LLVKHFVIVRGLQLGNNMGVTMKPVFYRLRRYVAHTTKQAHICGENCIHKDCLIRDAMDELERLGREAIARESAQVTYE
jgi:hypothetical protein